jgi:hypothetical protein
VGTLVLIIIISFRYEFFPVPVKCLYQAELNSLHVMQQVRIKSHKDISVLAS